MDHTSTWRHVARGGALVALALLLGSAANALSFRADFRRSTYAVPGGADFATLMAQHSSEDLILSTVTDGLENISTAVHASGVRRDYSVLLTTTFRVSVAGAYTFQVGTDWGRGGAAAQLDENGAVVSERVIEDDVWWAYNWNHPDVFTTTANLSAGDEVTLAWVGFEGCCGGSSTIRFAYEGGVYQPLTKTNFAPYAVPEASLLWLLGAAAAVPARRLSRPRGTRYPTRAL